MNATGKQAIEQRSSAIDPATTLGAVRLTVSDLARSRSFYEQAIGLEAREQDDGSLALGAGDSVPLIELHGDASAPRLERGATGLYHLAILVPTRPDLAVALARLAEARWPLDGASDHLVSEALYLSDPDGNGIEIYRDRPREEWQYQDGQLAMSTLPLDLRNLLGELGGASELPSRAPAGTKIGHVHLQVADLGQAEDFYGGLLGFEVMVRGYPGALFVAAGGYHHHVGLNTWQSLGADPPPPGAIGLRSFEIILPSEQALGAVLGWVQAGGLDAEPGDHGGSLIRDPSGNGVLLRAA